MSTPTALPATALSQLAPATAAPHPVRFLPPALARAGLYLTPVPLALAAAEPLARVPWPVPAGAAAAGWCALSGLGYLGRRAAGRAGAGAAVRLVLVGFAALAAVWAVLLVLAGPDRGPAYPVGLGVLLLAAALATALATGAEAVLLRWSVPALLVAGAVIGGWLPTPLLLAGIGLLAARLAGPAIRGTWPGWPAGRELWRCGAYAGYGLSQAAVVGLVWRVGEVASAGVPPVVVPLLVSVPLIEVWAGWHLARVAAGLARHDDRAQHERYARRLGWATLAVLLPPLVAGAALAGSAHRLPYRLSEHPDAPALVLAVAGGVLLAGVVAVGWLLAARDRPGLAAAVGVGVVGGTPVLAAAVPGLAVTSLGGWGQLLPATVIALAAAYAVGLVLAAYVLVDTRSLR